MAVPPGSDARSPWAPATTQENRPPRHSRGHALPALADSTLRLRNPDPSVSSTPDVPPTLWHRRRLLVPWGGGSCLSTPPSDPPPELLPPISKRSGASSRDVSQYWRCSLPRNTPE